MYQLCQEVDIQFMGMNGGNRQILLKNSLAKRKSLWFRASVFSKGDTEKCMVGVREADTQIITASSR